MITCDATTSHIGYGEHHGHRDSHYHHCGSRNHECCDFHYHGSCDECTRYGEPGFRCHLLRGMHAMRFGYDLARHSIGTGECDTR